MKSTRKLSRRSFLTRVAGGAVAAGGAMIMLSGEAQAQVTDSDSGPRADAAGRGRGNNHIRGCTDNDSGSNAEATSTFSSYGEDWTDFSTSPTGAPDTGVVDRGVERLERLPRQRASAFVRDRERDHHGQSST